MISIFFNHAGIARYLVNFIYILKQKILLLSYFMGNFNSLGRSEGNLIRLCAFLVVFVSEML